jgi:hypothetical protein
MKSLVSLALFLCALAGGGCLTADVRQAYPGAPLPAAETCALRVPAMLDVRAVDGVRTDWSLRVKQGSSQLLRLPAGTRRLLVRYYDPTADESRREVYEQDNIEVLLQANPQSEHELKYETWTRNLEMQRARQKVRVWVEPAGAGLPAPQQKTHADLASPQ